MEKGYWLGRKRASLKLAQDAIGSEARLIHYDLAGRYSVKAISDETQAIDLAQSLPPSIKSGGQHRSFDRDGQGSNDPDQSEKEIDAMIKRSIDLFGP